MANHPPNDRLPWAQTAALQHWKPPLVSVRSSFRMYCKQPKLQSVHLGVDKHPHPISKGVRSGDPEGHTITPPVPSHLYGNVPFRMVQRNTWHDVEHRSTAAPPWRCLAVHRLVVSRIAAACPGNRCEENNGFRKLYHVHIRAQISLYQTNANKCIHIWLNHHFINTFQTPTCFNP